jgi:phage gpG-like protein
MQIDILIEEMAELTQALLKTRRNGVVFSHAVFEEIADVQICLEQLDIQFGYLEAYKQIEQIKEGKLLRLKERLMQSMTEKLTDVTIGNSGGNRYDGVVDWL